MRRAPRRERRRTARQTAVRTGLDDDDEARGTTCSGTSV
jgi:hypothetical protein